MGDASSATAAVGQEILEYQAARFAILLQEVRRIDLDQWLRAAPLVDAARP
jgi:hypothetical protein